MKKHKPIPTRILLLGVLFLFLTAFFVATAQKVSRKTAQASLSSLSIEDENKAIAGFTKYCATCHQQFSADNGREGVKQAILSNKAEIFRRLDWDHTMPDVTMPPLGSAFRTQLADSENKKTLKKMRAMAKPTDDEDDSGLPLNTLTLKQGFKISVWAEVPGARSMTQAPDGTIYVGTGGLSGQYERVYRVRDANNDGKAEEVTILADGLNVPNGVAFKDGDLYIAEISRIQKIANAGTAVAGVQPTELSYKFPGDYHHGWKFIRFGPDGYLYIPVGANCNICLPGPKYGSIFRVKLGNPAIELYAKGIRNTVGFDFHPITKELWFTENGRDSLGDDTPPEELNRATGPGQHFGYPHCHGKDVLDPEYKLETGCQGFTLPAKELPAHVAPLGMRFYTGAMFPAEYKNNIFFAEHGSWNRSQPQGYRVSRVILDTNGNVTSYTQFAEGWLTGNGRWGRPADVEVWKDGSLLVSDDFAGVIYRITYN